MRKRDQYGTEAAAAKYAQVKNQSSAQIVFEVFS